MALAVIHACTLHPNPDGSLPVMRAKGLWDGAFKAGDTKRAFNFHRWAAIRNMLTDMGLLEWEDSTYQFGKAYRWRASAKLMERMESVLSGSSTSTPFPSGSIRRPAAVTQAEYEQVMGVNPSAFTEKQMDVSAFKPPLSGEEVKYRPSDRKKVAGKDTSRHPAETVSWEDAMEFCRGLSAMPAERTARRVYRLPSEAGWEYACRAGTTTRWYCGDDEAGLVEVAWFNKNAGGMTHPVAVFTRAAAPSRRSRFSRAVPVSSLDGLPADACPTFSAMYEELQRMEGDLHQHIHLENNILFPRAVELEGVPAGKDSRGRD
jgi:hypothetical protein